MPDSGVPQIDPQFLPSFGDAVAGTKKRGLVGPALSSGIDEMQGMLGGAAMVAGKLLGLHGVEQYGRGVMQRNDVEAQQNGRPDLEVAPWKQGGAPVLPWLGYQAIKQIPQLAGYIGAGALVPEAAVPAGLARFGAFVPRALGGGGALRTGLTAAAEVAGKDFAKTAIGAEIAGIPFAVGSMIQEADQKPGGATTGDALKAAALSPIYSALDAAEPGEVKGLLKRGMETEGKNALIRSAKRGITAGLLGGATEMPQEALQTAMEQSFRSDLSPKQKMTNIIDAAVTGGAVGGVFGGVAGGLRGMKTADAHAVTTDQLDEVTKTVVPPQVEPELPLQPQMQEFPTGYQPDMFGNRPTAGPDDTVALSGARDYGDLSRAHEIEQHFRALSDEDLHAAAEAVQNGANASQGTSEMLFAEMARRASLEPPTGEKLTKAEIARRARNNSLSVTNVGNSAVEAVEPNPTELGAAGGISAAPASTISWEDQRNTLLKGVATRKHYIDASSIDDLTERTRARLAAGSTAKSDLTLAERLGIDTNEKGAPVEAAQSRVQEPEQQTPLDPKWKAEWSSLTKDTRDQTIKRMNPVDKADARRQVFQALAGPERRDAGLGFTEVGKRLEKLARDLKLVDEDGQLTKVGQRVSRETIPMQEAVKAAMDRGFKGSAASAFDRGARSTTESTPKFDSFQDMAAFMAGRAWAIPKVATEQESRDILQGKNQGEEVRYGPVKGVMRSARTELVNSTIPDEQLQQRQLNQMVDAQYNSQTHPEENAQLKRMVANGATAQELDEAQRYFATGRGALANEPAPARPRDPNVRATQFGETYTPDPTTGRSVARSQLVKMRNEKHREVVRNELMKSLKLAADSQEIAGGKYVQLRQAIHSAISKNDFNEVRQVLSNIGGGAHPFIHINGRDVVDAFDHFAAQSVLAKMLESDSSATTLMAHLAMLGGRYAPIANMARRFAPFVPKDVGVTVATPAQMRILWENGNGSALPDGVSIGGSYFPSDRHIYIATDVIHPSVLLHEIVHSIIGSHIVDGTPIGREITRIYEKFREGIPHTDYAYTNANEFMAEFLSRKQVRDYVRNYAPKSLFSRMWMAIRKALGMPSQDYVEKLLNLAEKAGANPMGPSRYERASPMIYAKQVKEKLDSVGRAADTVVARDGAAGTIRKTSLGFATVHDITEFWGIPWFGDRGDNPVEDYEKAQDLKQSIVARMAQMLTTARDTVEHLMNIDKKAGESLVRLMTMSQFGIDPRRPWENQSARVRNSSNVENLKRIHADAHSLYNTFLVGKNKGAGARAYQNLHDVNDTQMLSQMAVSLHGQVAADTWANKELAKFAENPMERFMRAQEKEDFSPARAREWWAGELQEQLTALDNFMRKYRDIENSLDSGRIKDAREMAEIQNHMNPLKQRAQNIRQAIAILDEAPYFHLGRFGNYFVGWNVTSQEGLAKVADFLADKGYGAVISKDSEKANTYIRLENQRQQADLEKDIAKFMEANPGVIEEGSYVTGTRTSDTIRNGLADQWFDRMIADINASDELTDEAKARSIDFLQSLHLDLTPENSLARVLTQRQNVPGFSADMMRAFEHRANVGVNALAGMVVSPKIALAFAGMRRKEEDAQKAPIGTIPLAQRNGMTNVIDELSRREKERPDWPETRMLDHLRAINHAWFLGGSVAYGLVNMTQLGATLLPELAARHGFVKTVKAMAKITPLALRIIREVAREGAQVSAGRALDAVITRGALDRALTREVLAKAGVRGDMAEFIMRVANTGQLDIGGPAREMMRASEGAGRGVTDATLRAASSIGYYTETLSRLIAAMSSRELNVEEDTGKAAERASYVLKETMWNYNQSNQGRKFGKRGMFGEVTPLMTAFMQYQAQLTGKLYREVYEATKGTEDERGEARRFLSYHLGAMTVLAGSLGLPMASALAAAFDRLKDLFDDDDQPSDIRASWRNFLADTFGKDVGEILARGASRGVGIDISQRVGEQDIIPFSRFLADRRAFKDKIGDMQSRSWGAPASMVANALDGGDKIANGDILGGMARMLPNALSAGVKAYRMTDKGYVDTAGHELPMTPSSKDVLVQALGFNPAQNAEYGEARGDQQVRKGQLTREGTVLRNRMVSAALEGDRETALATLDRIRAFNQANPAFAIEGQDIESAMRRRVKATATSKITGTPLGTSVKDRAAQGLTRYANIDYPTQ